MYIDGLYQRKISGNQVKMMINVDFIELRSGEAGSPTGKAAVNCGRKSLTSNLG